MRGALDRFFPQAPCSLFANDPVGDIGSTYGSPSHGLTSRGPASPGGTGSFGAASSKIAGYVQPIIIIQR